MLSVRGAPPAQGGIKILGALVGHVSVIARRCATTGARVCFRTEQSHHAQYTEAFGRISGLRVRVACTWKFGTLFVLALYLTVTCPMFGCCRAEKSALDFRGDDLLGAWIHVVLQYIWLSNGFSTFSTSRGLGT